MIARLVKYINIAIALVAVVGLFFLVAAYVVLSFTFTWFALDAGLRSIDIHTLTEAAQSLGASRTRTLLTVILLESA